MHFIRSPLFSAPCRQSSSKSTTPATTTTTVGLDCRVVLNELDAQQDMVSRNLVELNKQWTAAQQEAMLTYRSCGKAAALVRQLAAKRDRLKRELKESQHRLTASAVAADSAWAEIDHALKKWRNAPGMQPEDPTRVQLRIGNK